MEYTDFFLDTEKMRDFFDLSKEEFLASYSYLTEIEYDLTMEKVQDYFTKIFGVTYYGG